ncbi:MAG: tryptophan 2,3-dioxygenase family protein, partial [Deltaproteobacteria bacterium]|nr:tryptophan 2,3-dioxygenase family protein [Deltaproteobacteria bacterium]
EQSMIIFRQRHARMVERVIGRRVGTGGSSGVEYLDRTALHYRVFRDLWATRTILIRQSALPPVQRIESYTLHAGE